MKMSFFYCVLSPSGLHHSVDDARQAADLTRLSAQVIRHRSLFAHYEVRFHLPLALDRDRASELRLVTPVHQDLHTPMMTISISNNIILIMHIITQKYFTWIVNRLRFLNF